MNGIVPMLLGLSLGVQAIPVVAANPSQQVKAVTVSIETPTSNGSGIIVSRQPGKYFVLTAAHVVRNQQSTYTIRTSDGQKYQIDKTNLFPQGIDLAVVSFSSSKSYPVATIGNSSDAEEGSTAAVSGYPRSDKQVPVYSYRTGRIVANSSENLNDGYGLVYNSSTLPGMSGGGVFNDKGDLIAIHGRGDITAPVNGSGGSKIKTGYDLGIPINTFIKLAKTVSSLPSFTQKVAKNPNRPRAGNAFLAGLGAMQQRDFAKAIGLFDQSIQLDGKDAVAYYYRGLCQRTLGNNDAALKDISQSIKLSPKNSYAYIFRAFIYLETNDRAKAIVDFDKAIQVDPTNSYAYTFHVNVYGKAEDLPKIVADLNRAIQLDPSNAHAYQQRGMMYLGPGKGNRAKFIADYERAAALFKASGEIEASQSITKFLEMMKKYGGQEQ
jgi:Tfp pilus assembly protein PilF